MFQIASAQLQRETERNIIIILLEKIIPDREVFPIFHRPETNL